MADGEQEASPVADEPGRPRPKKGGIFRMRKFSVDQQRLSARIAAAEGANAACLSAGEDERAVRDKLAAVRAKAQRDSERYRLSNDDFAKHREEIAKLEAEIVRLKAAKDLLNDKWVHLGAIADRCQEYAEPRKSMFFLAGAIA
ncbi:hypothetical protein NKJ13_21630 [Mesorhizobium sp. M0174]|uniref:hypothetical protein n=1 Tax=Mesorhizobium sp. M0174 TaxID=2956904 RepID=UPI00333C6682